MPQLEARGSDEVWSWDITYLPTSVDWLSLYGDRHMVIDVWSRKVVAWDVAEREEAQIAVNLIGQACLRDRISKGRSQPLILHVGNAMRAATLESRLEELGVLRSFSWPRVNNDNPYSESLFRTVKYRPDYPRRPFQSVEEACNWVAALMGWYNDQHRHSGILFVTPSQIATAEKRLRPATTVPASTSRPVNSIHSVGMEPPAVGVSRRLSGSILHTGQWHHSSYVTAGLKQLMTRESPALATDHLSRFTRLSMCWHYSVSQ